jgi:hypothetical protein
MGMAPISNSSFDEGYGSAPNPNLKNFEISRSLQIGNFLVIKIIYSDCYNYEGNKILVFEGVTLIKLLKQEIIDPHFSDKAQYYSPIARFVPTDEGWYMAKVFAENMQRERWL